MLIYLLKFSACLAIFVVFYKLFLERERMHQLKRFYLLGAIFISLSFPRITFTTYVEPIVVSNVTSFESFPEMSVEQGSVEAPATNFLPIILWSIYGLGVLLFGIKFILNLSKIVFKIKRNPKHVAQDYTHVLLRDLVTPHTFFSYIFLNKQKFETQQIPLEVFVHEQAHAKQKHSIDVLLVELLQMVFWFNPLIYLTKQFIKMNHEFLADEAVIKQGIEPSNYQQLLLTFSSNVTEPQLANAINYSSIKKRFTVMKTHTSKQKIWTLSFLLLPLIAVILYGFSERQEVVKPSEDFQTSNSDYTARSISIEVLEDGTYIIDGITSNKSTLITEVNKLHQDITPEIRNDIMNIHVTSTSEISNEEVWFIYNSLLDYGFYRLVTPEQEVVKGKGNTPYAIDQTQQKATPEEAEEYNKLAKHCNSELSKQHPIIKVKEVERVKFLYNKMSSDQKKNSVSFPDFSTVHPPPSPETGFIEVNGETLWYAWFNPVRYYNKKGYLVDKNGKTINGNNQVNASDVLPGQYITKVYKDDKVVVEFKDNSQTQKRATPEEISEYNKIAKHYNSQNPNNTIIKQKDFDRMKSLYNKMSKEQKANAEHLPKMVPPPPPPPVPKTPSPSKKSMEIIEVPMKEEVINGKTYQYTMEDGNKKYFDQYGEADIVEVQAPPPPIKSPLDHVIEMAKKGAIFYNEGKLISSDEAIKLLKENHELNVATKESESKEPKVYISKNPIKIVTQNNSKEPILVNGKKVKENSISMTKEDLAKASFSTKDGDISSFMFKIPGVKTESITGNKLNDAAKANLEKVQIGDAIQLFMIKDSKSAVHPPVLITIIK